MYCLPHILYTGRPFCIHIRPCNDFLEYLFTGHLQISSGISLPYCVYHFTDPLYTPDALASSMVLFCAVIECDIDHLAVYSEYADTQFLLFIDLFNYFQRK